MRRRGRRWFERKYDTDLVLSHHAAPGPLPYVLVLDNLKGSFNVPKIIRSANVLGCREVHLINIPPFDPSPAKGALRYTPTRSFTAFAESQAWLAAEGYRIYALHVGGDAILGQERFPPRSAFVAGHEEWGFSFDLQEFPEVLPLRIPQLGVVQSLNVSVAASLACFEYVRQHGDIKPG